MARRTRKKAAVKTARKKKASVRRGAGSGLSADALIEANEALTDSFEREHAWRQEILKSNELLARKAVESEIDVKNMAEKSKELTKRLRGLTEELRSGEQEVGELVKQANRLEKQRDNAVTRQAGLEGEVSTLEREVRELTRAQDSLQKKAQSLKSESAKLSTDVSRLEELRTQYLNEIAKFKEAKRRLTSM